MSNVKKKFNHKVHKEHKEKTKKIFVFLKPIPAKTERNNESHK